MKKGVSLIALVITIIVIIILASITYFYGIDTIEQAHLTRREAELEEVVTFVRAISSRAEATLIDLTLTEDTLVDSGEKFYLFRAPGYDSEFTPEVENKIDALNKLVREQGKPERGYHYITGSQIENDLIPGMEGIASSNASFTVPNKVENNYIINFYYGTVIARVSNDKTLVRGQVR